MTLPAILRRPDLRSGRPAITIRRGALVTGTGLAFQGVLRLAFLVLAARALGPSAYSQVGIALAVGMLAAILGPASLGSAFSKFVGRRADPERSGPNDGASHHILRRAAGATLSVGILSALAVTLLADPSLAVPAAVLAVGLASQALGRGIHLGLGLSTREALLQIGAGAAALVVLVALVALDRATPAVVCLVLGAAYIVYLTLTLPRGAHGGADRPLRREIDGFVALAVLGSVASAGLVQLCITAAQVRLPSPETGQLAAAVSLATPIALVASAVNLVGYPRMSQLALSPSTAPLRELRHRFTVLLGLLGLLGAGTAALVAEPVVTTVLGEDFSGTAGPLVPLVVGVIFTTIASASASAMSATRNRSLAAVSGSAWLGLLTAIVVWVVCPPSPLWIALGFALGSWVSATVIIIVADRSLRAALTWRWVPVSALLWAICIAHSS